MHSEISLKQVKEPRKRANSHPNNIPRVPAAEIFKLSLSPYFDDIAVFHVRAVSLSFFFSPSWASQTLQGSPTRELRSQANIPGCLSSEAVKRKGDFVFQTGHVIEIVTKLFLVVQNATGKPPTVNINTQFDANFGTHSVTFQFKASFIFRVFSGFSVKQRGSVIFWCGWAGSSIDWIRMERDLESERSTLKWDSQYWCQQIRQSPSHKASQGKSKQGQQQLSPSNDDNKSL